MSTIHYPPPLPAQNGHPFVDDSFPPVPRSLWYSGNGPAQQANEVGQWAGRELCETKNEWYPIFYDYIRT